ncbi:hypothetical protein [Stackebrandtia nassauensis]|uniref:Uncharacterized protein n=1 Tax=Stackebrandtia nassauensis (strain DSM 44728 / CIP 108903 / NRRL B-16338 / NBRC 102104 / LLR-40K-21) TaxID=446470 RepID=D3Q2D1_STANL|nr:hypothetical protein [Stackebrandtia nassauensis]ADD43864.1 hypothetical protein Snas_4215 [Stackebrandtia nassauensis DSM 44728]
MTTQTRKRRGRATEQAVAAAMRADGWPYAEPVGAGRQGSDITGTPGLSLEVKARRGLNLGAWLSQAVRQADDGEVPILVVRLDGQGPASVDEWPSVVPFAVLRRLLRLAGYGNPTPPPPGLDNPVADPAREARGTGETVDYWLGTPGGGDWLGCMACQASAAGRDPAGLAHAPRCPHAEQGAAA